MKKYYLSSLYLVFYFMIYTSLCSQTMISIPTGSYTMGTAEEYFFSAGTTDRLPESIYTPHRVKLDAFKISEYEIDAKLFLEFLEEAGPGIFDTDGSVYKYLLKENAMEYSGYPAVSTYFYALDFCSWLGKKHNKKYRLPTEAEWEYAATGGNMQSYPWGKEYRQLSKAEVPQRLALSSFEADNSPFGIKNMYANVAEWVLDYFQSDFYTFTDMYNPICVAGKQLSIDKNFGYPPTYIVRGENRYFYDNRLEIPMEVFTGIKIRHAYWHNTFEPYSKIGFRIVEDSKNNFFLNKGKKIRFSYSTGIAVSDTDVLLDFNCNDISIENDSAYHITKGAYVKTLFVAYDCQGKKWYCVQFFDFRSDTGGTERGDKGGVGWVSAKRIKIISNR